MASVTVRYFAGARAAAGVDEEVVEAGSVVELVERLGSARGERLSRTLRACSFLVDGRADHGEPLDDGVTVDVLPPFAGG